MYYRQRDNYLKTAGGMAAEDAVVKTAMSHISRMDHTLNMWRPLWSQIKKYFLPDLNVVYQMGTGGEIRSNQVWTSKPMTYFMQLVYFYYVSMFPEKLFLNHAVRDRGGREIPKGKLSPLFLKHLDDLHECCVYEMERGGFFDQSLPFIAHYLLLGNSALKTSLGVDGNLVYRDVPVDALAVQRDSNGKVWGFAWRENIERWQLIRDYGEGVKALFTQPLADRHMTPNNLTLQWAGISEQGGHGGSVNYGAGSLGTATGAGGQLHSEDISYLHVPNQPHTGVPGAGRYMPEMGYVTYVIGVRTRRLIDVWLHPDSMYGVSADIRTMGENYARGLGGRLLPDVAGLNEHRKAVLRGRGMAMQSPFLVAGDAPLGLKKGISPFQVIKVSKDTNVQPLFQPATIFRNTKDAEDMEIANFRESAGINNVHVEMADRMTATEYRQRKDGSWSQFHPVAQQMYRGIKQVIQATQDHVYLSGKMPPPPPEMLLSGLNFEIDLRSVFSFGAKEEGANLTRALAPFMELLPVQPEMLDWVDTEAALRKNMSNYHVADVIKSAEEVEKARDARAQREAAMKGGGGGNESPVRRGMDRAMEAEVEGRARGLPSGNVVVR